MANVEIKQENLVYAKPRLITNEELHYCPGCSHGTVHKLIAEVIDEMGLEGSTIGVSPVGCSVFAYRYIDVDWVQAAHGRACAVATAIKRLHPKSAVFTYQGDGDLAAIGTGETIHAAARGENIVTIFINNAIYGMTGGQMAPTTLEGQYSTTSQKGRDVAINGYPIHVCEMLSQLKGPQYIERVSTHDAQNVLKAKKAIKKAFQYQLEGKGFSMIEVLVACPTNWKMSPEKALQHIKEEVTQYFPLGVYKDRG